MYKTLITELSTQKFSVLDMSNIYDSQIKQRKIYFHTLVSFGGSSLGSGFVSGSVLDSGLASLLVVLVETVVDSLVTLDASSSFAFRDGERISLTESGEPRSLAKKSSASPSLVFPP